MVRWEAALIAVFGTVTGLAVGMFLGWAMVFAVSQQVETAGVRGALRAARRDRRGGAVLRRGGGPAAGPSGGPARRLAAIATD
jgi:ABC-type antimicrobial peptide transport system permease subunit